MQKFRNTTVKNGVKTELHTYGDASEEAYAAVSYIRNVYIVCSVVVRHIKAATKLAPKKVASIPRLELNAVLLASRLARTVQQAIMRDIQQRYFGPIVVRCVIG